MTNIPGADQPLIVIGDTDALIAVLNQEDTNFQSATRTVNALIEQDAQILFPLTTIVETVTTLIRKLNSPQLASKVVQQVAYGELAIEAVDGELLQSALTVFDPRGSKKNTLFDALVVACAKQYKTSYIFSFDGWYEKLGFQIVSEAGLRDEKST